MWLFNLKQTIATCISRLSALFRYSDGKYHDEINLQEHFILFGCCCIIDRCYKVIY
jgi:hypothetical protein